MTEAEILAAHNGKCEENEALYTKHSGTVQKLLQKGMMIRGAILSYEMKLEKAAMELDRDLETIEQNFRAHGATQS